MTESTVKENGIEVTIKTDGSSLAELLRVIEQAIRGAGYVFDGELDIIKEEE